MKNLLSTILLIIVSFFCQTCFGQITTWSAQGGGSVPTNFDLIISSNQVVEIYSYNLDFYGSAWLNTSQQILYGNSLTTVFPAPLKFAGPTTLRFTEANPATNVGSFITYAVVEKYPPPTPASTVVIPTDAAGPVQIILESSTDLVNWNSALPGTYGASTTNRFFRVRAVRQ